MNKQNTFKLAILTLLLNGAVACTNKPKKPAFEPATPEYKALMHRLDSLSQQQNITDRYYWVQSPEIMEVMRQDTTNTTLHEKLKRAYEITQQHVK